MIDIKAEHKRDYICTTVCQHFIWDKKFVGNDRKEKDLCQHP